MSKLRQEDMLSFYFNRSLQLEDILIKKLEVPKKTLQNEVLEPMIKDFRKNSKEHLRDLQEKMIHLGVK